MDDDGAPVTGTLRKRKVDPTTGRWRVVAEWPVSHLGDDQHGTWVGARRGTLITTDDGATAAQTIDLVRLLPPARPWVACFWGDARTIATVDVALPPTRDGEDGEDGESDWTFDDLELDLWLNTRGEAGAVDQDELDAVAHLLPSDVVELAVRTADELLPLVQRRTKPFGTASKRWMAALLTGPGPGGRR